MSTAPSAGTVDPKEVFKHALQFHFSANILDGVTRAKYDTAAAGRQFMLPTLAPMVALSAFSIELYFKCIYAIENNGGKFREHRLRLLFHQLTPASRNRITELWEEHSQRVVNDIRKGLDGLASPDRYVTLFSPMGVTFIDRDVGVTPTPTLDQLLSDADTAFERWRYAYERGPTNYEINSLELAVRQTILEIKPDWTDLVIALGTPPTFLAR